MLKARAAFPHRGARAWTHCRWSRNGKIDRAALPQPDSVQIAQDEYVATTPPKAIARTKIFEEVLHMDPVGATSDLLKMGADSIDVKAG
jgi:hypothetical protein